MYRVNTQVITMVQGELEKELQVLMQLLEDAQDTIDTEAFAEHLALLGGAIRLLELPAAEALFSAMVSVVEQPEHFQPGSDAAYSVHHALKCLPGYLKQLQQQGEDNVLLLLPEINELRSIAGMPLLNEWAAMGKYCPDYLPLLDVPPHDETVRQVISAVRRLFQQGLVHAIKGGNHQAAIKVMAQGIHRLRKTLPDPAERDYWSLVFEVLSAFHRGSLGLEHSRFKTLMAVERQLRVMEDNAAPDHFYPQDLQQKLMAYFALSGLQGEGASILANRLGIQSPGYSLRDVIARREAFSGEGAQSLSLLITTIAGQVEHLRQLLDQAMAEEQVGEELFHEIDAGFRLLGELCEQSHLKLAGKRCEVHLAALHSVGAGRLPMELYEQLADTLLYLDCVLSELQTQAVTEARITKLNTRSLKQVVEENIVEHAERRALQEAADHLAAVMQMSSDYCEGIAGDEVAQPLVDNFRQIVGPMGMLGLKRAEAVSRRCLDTLNRCLATDGDVSLASTMAVFADAIVSLEYYIQNRRLNRQFEDTVLGVAEERLASLEPGAVTS